MTQYFYIIKDKITNKKYVGSKYGKDADPSKFMVKSGYKTSQKLIKHRIQENGLQSFEILYIETFENPEDALKAETMYLMHNNAAESDEYYNMHNNQGIFDITDNVPIIYKKYGVDHQSQIPWVMDKIKQTNLERYGVECTLQAEHVKEKIKQTNLERYGVEHNFKSEVIKEKIKQTNLEKYGVDNYSKTDQFKEKFKQTNLEKYGVEHHSKTDEFKDYCKKLNLEKYGVDNYSKTDEFKEKFKQTNLEKYGVTHYSKNQDYKDRMKQNNINLYGYENYQTYAVNRPDVIKIKEYKKKFKMSLPRNWFVKNDDEITKILDDLIKEFGPL